MDVQSPTSLAAADPNNLLVSPEDRVTTKKRTFSDTVVCTACSQRLDAYRLDWMRRHPLLDVLLCKRCYTMHTSKEIQIGEDGKDEACRWCALEGDLICCDFCHNVFCKLCIRRNLGRTHLNIILNADEDQKWQCYVCNPEPLAGLVGMCTEILQAAEEEYESKPISKKPVLSPEEDDADLSSMQLMPARSKRGRKPGISLPKVASRSLDMLKKEQEAASEAELDEIIGKMEDENEEFVAGVDDPDFSLEEHLDGLEKQRIVASAKDEVVYIKTPSGEIVALRASSTKEATPSLNMAVPRRPKGRPRIHRLKEGSIPRTQSSISSGAQGKKYPRSSSQYKNSMSSLAALADVKLSSRPPDINQHNIWFVLEKLLASTQSMTMVLASLKEDLKRANAMSNGAARNPELRKKKAEVSVKLWRAFLAYKKSFVDLEVSSKDGKSHQEMGEFFDEGNADYEYYEEYDEAELGLEMGTREGEEEDEEALALQQQADGAEVLVDEGQSGQPMNGNQVIIQADDGSLQQVVQN